MNEKGAFQQARPCPGGSAGLIARVRVLCVIRLIGLLVFAGTANVCMAQGPIRDPLNPQAYMSELASRLDSPDSKDLLTKGMKTQKVQKKAQKAESPPANPAPSKAAVPPATAPVPGDHATKVPAAAPAPATNQTIIPAASAVPIRSPILIPAASTVSSGSVASVPVGGPVGNDSLGQVPGLTAWNGLSPGNQAAQRALQELEASRAARVAALSRPVESDKGTASAARTAAAGQETKVAVGPLNQSLMSAGPGLSLWTTPTPANLAEKIIIDPSVALQDPNVASADANASPERKAWSLGSDLDKYRAHAVKEGSRSSGQSLKKALEKAGLAVGDGVNVFILGYGSDRAKPFRVNDGKGLLDEPGKVPQRAGTTVVSFADGMYSLADLIAFDSLPDPIKDAYGDNHPLVRPLIFTGRTIGGVWKTTEEVGNAVTWGYFDNVTGCVGIVIEDIMELVKHVGQAATNLVRAPVRLVAGKKEGVERTMDWILLVPLEFVTNSSQMKGIANMDDYKTAFEDKGVIGSIVELGGSTFLAYRMVDELVDRLKDDKGHHRSKTSEPEPETPTEPTTPTAPHGTEALFLVEGEWPDLTSGSGVVYFDGPLPAITVLIE
ncbi:MAG TPA: hypothetical protein PKH24_01450 [Sedimentisphaerales bacterium]|nr:hypothetical protein [Sedimentisphaerales bacterium]HNU28131.1 hypothetical protein [Sedimentisphaerales bacterium]